MTPIIPKGTKVRISIYDAGPKEQGPKFYIFGTVYNSGSEYDILINEDERGEAIEALNELAEGLGDLVARDHYILRNVQVNEIDVEEDSPYIKKVEQYLNHLGEAVRIGDNIQSEASRLLEFVDTIVPEPGLPYEVFMSTVALRRLIEQWTELRKTGFPYS